MAAFGCVHSPRVASGPNVDVRVAVFVRAAAADDASRRLADEIAVELTSRLARGGADVIPRTATTARDPEALLREAEDLFYALSTERAAEAARELVACLESGACGRFERQTLVRTLLLLAEAANAVGEQDESGHAIDRLVQAQPDVELDATRYSPVLRERVAQRLSDATGTLATLVFGELPEDALVWVDGAAIAPDADHVSLVPGAHIVRFEAPSYATITRVVWVDAGGSRVSFDGVRTPEAIDSLAGDPRGPLGVTAAAISRDLEWTPWLLDARSTAAGVELRWWRPPHGEPVVVEGSVALPPSEFAERIEDAVAERTRRAAADLRARTRRRRVAIVLPIVAASAGATATGIVLRPRAANGWDAQGTIEGAP